jgi:tetratricopeptide (TPR) repeat protein
MEAVELKGKAEPIPVWRATQARSRFIVEVDKPTSPFIGRDSEIELLRQAFRRMIREESVQLVTVTGEPGVGKSRLVGEFFAWVDAQPEICLWRHGRCLPYGDGVTFWALGEIVKAQAGILETDSPAAADAKLVAAVELVVEDAADRDWIAGHLAALVGSRPGSEASADRAETFSAWRAFLEAMAAHRPLILVIEDLHWADDAMIEFVEHLADWATGVPMLILCTARPELYERRPGWGGGKRNSTTVALSPLHADEIAALVASMLEETLLPAETQAALLERAGGNPLYAEEFVRMLTDRGILRRQGRAWQLGTDADIPVPDTVQALIAARMDTLPPERKALLHDAAVIGRVFWPGALATMGGADAGDVVNGLHDLLRKELVRPVRRSSMQGEDEFTFWHILVRDVAYAQIPRAQRAERHRKAAGWIERAAGERAGDHAEILAHHYLQAIELSGRNAADDELRAAAGRYLYLAGDRASQLDFRRAIDLFRQSKELSGPDDAWYGDLLIDLGGTLMAMGRQQETAVELEAARRYFTDRGNPTRAAFATTMLGLVTRHMNQMDRTRELFAEARAVLESQPPSFELNRVYAAMAGDAMLRSQYRESFAYAQKAIEIADTLDRPELKVRPLQARGWAKWDERDVAGALADLGAAVELAVAKGYPGEAAVAYNNYAGLRWNADGPAAGLETYTEGMLFSTRRGMEGTRMWSFAESTLALYDLGRWDEVLTAADEVAAESKARSWTQPAGFSEPMRAKVLFQRGDLEGATSVSEANLVSARMTGDPQLVIPALEVESLLAAAGGRTEEARAALLEVERITSETAPLVLSAGAEFIRVACQIGDVALAGRLADVNLAIPGRPENIVVEGRAVIAETEGRFEEAAAGHREAVERWATYGSLPEQGLALIGLGRCLLALGRAAEATEPFLAARELFAPLGAVRLVGEVDELLAQTSARAG